MYFQIFYHKFISISPSASIPISKHDIYWLNDTPTSVTRNVKQVDIWQGRLFPKGRDAKLMKVDVYYMMFRKKRKSLFIAYKNFFTRLGTNIFYNLDTHARYRL